VYLWARHTAGLGSSGAPASVVLPWLKTTPVSEWINLTTY
jgi:hypothetical protein